jgi:3-oxoacyl-[acyl-carrier-protein] synthase III
MRELCRAINYAEIIGWGSCLPPSSLTNDDLAEFLDTSDEWIVRRTGIRQRPISHVPVSKLAFVAGARALACAGLEASELGLIVLGSCTNDEQMPNTASGVQRSLGAVKAGAIDINTACTSFMYGLSVASSMIATGIIETALVIGADTMSSYLDWNDRRPSILFGDGAGAVVLRRTGAPTGVLGEVLGCNYESRDVLRIRGIGSAYANRGVTLGTVAWDFDGPEIFRLAVHGMASAARKVLSKCGYSIRDVDIVIPHQANLRIVQAVAQRLNLAMDQIFTNIELHGNLSSASIPVAIAEALENGRIQPGNLLLIPAFGGGMTWSAHIVLWSDRVLPIAKSEVELTPSDKTAMELVRSLRLRKAMAGVQAPEPTLPS